MNTPRCNGRKKGRSDLPTVDPGEWAGDGYCKASAGRGTDHVGEGRCKHHGGANPVRHGLYSATKRDQLGDLIERAADRDEPLDLLEELAVVRALLADYLASRDEPDPGDVTKIASEISKIVKRIEDIRAQDAISLPDLERLMFEMGRVLQAEVEDDETVQTIRERWREIRL